MAQPTSNSAAVLYGINDLRVHEWALPKELAAGHVRIQMSNVGICGSDVHFLQHGRWERHTQQSQNGVSAKQFVAAVQQAASASGA
jgi:threonine dehydrogenase-like Zn-dependent dehydrogenase